MDRVSLCQLLLEYGYSATESPDTLSKIQQQAHIQILNETILAELLITCLSTLKGHVPKIPPENPSLNSWNVNVLVQVAVDSVSIVVIKRKLFFLKSKFVNNHHHHL
jgi:hypothetical protein